MLFDAVLAAAQFGRFLLPPKTLQFNDFSILNCVTFCCQSITQTTI